MLTTLTRTVRSSFNDGSADSNTLVEEKDLLLLFLGCEVLPPYGPYEHTATLFLDLIAAAVAKTLREGYNHQRTVRLRVYGVSSSISDQSLYPSDNDLMECDGVILPGSFSSAYDDAHVPWIAKLKDWIQTNLVAQTIPTLGVCFGHQLYAHSFPDGTAVKCPAGPQAGRKTTALTPSGQAFLKIANDDSNDAMITTTTNSSMDLFYTHGDMVDHLPPRGVSLGGNDTVPIQSVLYVSDPAGVAHPEKILLGKTYRKDEECRVIAVTFQAHPEFSGLGDQTLHNTMALMNRNGDLCQEDFLSAKTDAFETTALVRDQSVAATIAAGRLLGWLPC